MESYFDYVPKELIVNIMSYLDPLMRIEVETKGKRTRYHSPYKSYESIEDLNTSIFLKTFDISLNNSDWGYLFSLRFPQYFSKNLYSCGIKGEQCYEIPKIYLEMIILEPQLREKIEVIKNLKPITSNSYIYFIRDIDEYQHAAKYLVLE